MNTPIRKFKRALAPAWLQKFCPDFRANQISEIDPQLLINAGINAVLLDLDNTLLPWKGHELPETTINWVKDCKSKGLIFCLVSNTRNRPRLEHLSRTLDIPFVIGKMKPSRQMFHAAMKKIGTTPNQTIMIGDQMFTDIWGGNRVGIKTLWVEPMAKREFFGTKISRMAEKWVKKAINKAEE